MSDDEILQDFNRSHEFFDSLGIPILDIFVVPFGSLASYDNRLIYACSLFGYKSIYVTHLVDDKQSEFAKSLGINLLSRVSLSSFSNKWSI